MRRQRQIPGITGQKARKPSRRFRTHRLTKAERETTRMLHSPLQPEPPRLPESER